MTSNQRILVLFLSINYDYMYYKRVSTIIDCSGNDDYSMKVTQEFIVSV